VADTDRSGYVTDEEGKLFGRRAFLGITAAQVPELRSAEGLAEGVSRMNGGWAPTMTHA
jgi:hypothetical protein